MSKQYFKRPTGSKALNYCHKARRECQNKYYFILKMCTAKIVDDSALGLFYLCQKKRVKYYYLL